MNEMNVNPYLLGTYLGTYLLTHGRSPWKFPASLSRGVTCVESHDICERCLVYFVPSSYLLTSYLLRRKLSNEFQGTP